MISPLSRRNSYSPCFPVKFKMFWYFTLLNGKKTPTNSQVFMIWFLVQVFPPTYKKEYLSIHLCIFLTAEQKTSISDECGYQKISETHVIHVSIIWKQETVTFKKLESFEFLIWVITLEHNFTERLHSAIVSILFDYTETKSQHRVQFSRETKWESLGCS